MYFNMYIPLFQLSLLPPFSGYHATLKSTKLLYFVSTAMMMYFVTGSHQETAGADAAGR